MACEHLTRAKDPMRRTVRPGSEGCQECLLSGDTWVHLRLCLDCGHVGCCNSSPNRHATRHFHETRHPVIRSFEPGELWGWCFEHQESAELEARAVEAPRRHFDPPQPVA